MDLSAPEAIMNVFGIKQALDCVALGQGCTSQPVLWVLVTCVFAALHPQFDACHHPSSDQAAVHVPVAVAERTKLRSRSPNPQVDVRLLTASN